MEFVAEWMRFGAMWKVFRNTEGYLECFRTTKTNKDGDPIDSERRCTLAKEIDELKAYFPRKYTKKSKHTEVQTTIQ